MRSALFWHGRRTLIRRLALLVAGSMLGGSALVVIQWPAAASGPNVSILSSWGWSETSAQHTLHLTADVANSGADASLVQVNFNLFNASGALIGHEISTTGLDILAGGATSGYTVAVPPPSGYDHFTAASLTAAQAATPPDQNFTVSAPAPCDSDLCGTITNNNPVAVDDVHIAFSLYADAGKTQIVDAETRSLANNASSSLAAAGSAGATAPYELVLPPGVPAWAAIIAIGESSTTTPAAPFDAFATRGNRSASVSWSAPPDGGRAITGYTVTSSPAVTPVDTPDGNTTHATVPGLTNGVSYTFTVTATNAIGTGPPSAPSNVVVPATVPDAPIITSLTPGNASVQVTWTAPSNEGSPITSYLVAANPGSATATVDGNQTSATVTGLTNGTAYTFTVTASNALGAGPPSAASGPATPAVAPGAPTQAAASPFNSSAQVTWQAPASNGGSPITTYTVTSSPGGKTAFTADGSTTTATVPGLTNGVSYTFTVTATNAVGTGPASARSNAVTPSTNSGPPPPPPPPVFGSWDPTGGILAFGPVASTWGVGRLDIFVGGTDGILYHRFVNGTTGQWEGLPGTSVTSEASAISTGVGTVDVFIRGGDRALWHRHFTSSGWQGWERLGGVLASAPSAVSLGSGRIAVFVQGTDNVLYFDSFNETTGWTWFTLGGVLAGGPAAVSATPGAADAFVMGADGALWRWSSTGNGSWTGLGGRIAARPAVTSRSGGILDVFVQGIDGALWHWSSTKSWEGLGGRMTLSPAAVSTEGIRLEVFVRGTDGGLWHDGFDGTNWSWDGLAGQLTSAPNAVSWGPTHVDVVIRSSDRSLWHLTTTG